MIIRREKELDLLNNIFYDNKLHFLSIYGRRGVGKTFLINEAFKDKI